MILAIDVQYKDSIGYVAGVMFSDWCDKSSLLEVTSILEDVSDYIPGQFYKRELPCILKLITEHNLMPEIIIIDGYVYLDEHEKSGIGKYLYDHFDKKIKIIGVAKNKYKGISDNFGILRGDSLKPLYVTSTINNELAKSNIKNMFGEFRQPLLIKRADQLCRELSNS